MNFKKKMLIIIMVLLFAAPSMIFADCVKTAKGLVRFSVSYKVRNDGNRIRQTPEIPGKVFLRMDGRYGGGCATFVGRQRARRRACNKAIEAMKQHFIGNPSAQKNYIKEKINSIPNNSRYTNLKNAEWIKIEYFKLFATPVDQRSKSKRAPGYISRFYVVNATKEKFINFNRATIYSTYSTKK